MKIEKGLRIRLRVELKVKDGDVLEKSAVEYVQGGGTMLPGLEAELEGLSKGDKKEGTIPAKKAFGSPQQQPTKSIPRNEFPEDAKLDVGERFGAKGPGGEDIFLEVLESNKDSIEVRFVHPLADKDIEYDVEILSVTNPAPPPLPADAVTVEED